MQGIYCYMDKKDGSIVYVGKDKHIDINRRHKQHLQPSQYNAQPFNRILQNNPNRYEYDVLRTGEFNNNWLSALEILYIRRYNPKFNYTIGGDGAKGYNMTDAHKQKISKALKNKPKTEEHKQKLKEANIGQIPWNTGKKWSDEVKNKISISLRNRYAKIIKNGNCNGKQMYAIYRNGKIIKQSFYPSKLLEWFAKKYPKEILILKEGSYRTVKGSEIIEGRCN